MPRPTLTLLVIYPHKVVRADFGRGARGATPALLHLRQQARPDVDDIGILVEAAALQGPRLRGPVWIVWSDLFAHSLHLDAKSMGLQGRELESALAFEAEPLSGISAFDSVVAYRQTGVDKGERDFWVLQARLSDVELMRETVARLGGRLAGITSTVGLEIPLLGAIDSAGASDDVFAQWLIGCAVLVNDKKNQPAALVPSAKPLTTKQRWLIALALALPIALLCTAQYTYLAKPAAAQMTAEMKKAQEAVEKGKAFDKQIADNLKLKEDLSKHNDDLTKATAILQTQRKRLASLLAQIGHYRNEELLILKIDCAGGEPNLHGLCLQPGAATDFARKMTDSAHGLGWQVQSPKSQAQNLLPNGGPWSFDLQFKDVLAPVDLLPASKTQPRTMKR